MANEQNLKDQLEALRKENAMLMERIETLSSIDVAERALEHLKRKLSLWLMLGTILIGLIGAVGIGGFAHEFSREIVKESITTGAITIELEGIANRIYTERTGSEAQQSTDPDHQEKLGLSKPEVAGLTPTAPSSAGGGSAELAYWIIAGSSISLRDVRAECSRAERVFIASNLPDDQLNGPLRILKTKSKDGAKIVFAVGLGPYPTESEARKDLQEAEEFGLRDDSYIAGLTFAEILGNEFRTSDNC